MAHVAAAQEMADNATFCALAGAGLTEAHSAELRSQFHLSRGAGLGLPDLAKALKMDVVTGWAHAVTHMAQGLPHLRQLAGWYLQARGGSQMWQLERQFAQDLKSLWDAHPDLRTQMEASPVGRHRLGWCCSWEARLRSEKAQQSGDASGCTSGEKASRPEWGLCGIGAAAECEWARPPASQPRTGERGLHGSRLFQGERPSAAGDRGAS